VPKREEVTEEWRKLHDEELHDLCCLPNVMPKIKSRRMRWAKHVARMGEKRNAFSVSVGKQEGRRPLARFNRAWQDNIKKDFKGME
jgi:hypothetical protein